ncbi:hypothetical protein Ahy_A06g026106 [Arachis hypogaea]|uniref:MULE transposase domain-containing protein n=1 Tax=Arachis hypogaea TaxID=3818 RepID=A0A445CJE8_ARAHY|nr:hypothetical protein Ahy_A06g026106 [Arachis hypogaea]
MARDAGSKARSQGLTRCGCLREMRKRPKCNSGIWYVSRFVDNHNHDLLPAKFVAYLPSYRKIFDVDLAHMDSLRQVRISIPKIYESIVTQGGGFNLVSFTKRDMYNEVKRQRALRNGDVNAALRFFERCARRDEKVFWRFEVGLDQHMCDLFWSDGCSKDDYKIFGDVLAFDVSYDWNKYNLPIVVFFGVNHHNQTCVFPTAIVLCESQASYVWVLTKFLECMGDKAPKASLILQRWSKTAKLHVMEPSIVNKGDAIALYKSRVGVFLHHCKRFTAVASMKDKDFKVYLEKVVRDTVVLELKNEVGRSDGGENNNLEQDVVHDSVDVRIKGTCHAHDPLGSRE